MINAKYFWMATAGAVAVFAALFLAGFPVTAENQAMEIAQVILLVMAFVVMAQSHIEAFQTAPRSSTQNADLSFALFLSAIPFAGAGRELNFGRMVGAGPDLVGLVQVAMGGVVLLLIALSLGLLFAKVEARWTEARRIFSGPICRVMYLATLMFLVADFFEKQKTGAEWSVFFEETAEFLCFALILRAGLLVRQRVRE